MYVFILIKFPMSLNPIKLLLFYFQNVFKYALLEVLYFNERRYFLAKVKIQYKIVYKKKNSMFTLSVYG